MCNTKNIIIMCACRKVMRSLVKKKQGIFIRTLGCVKKRFYGGELKSKTQSKERGGEDCLGAGRGCTY